MKKFLAIMLAVLMLLCLFACGKEEDSNLTDNEGAVKEEELVYNNFVYDTNAEGTFEIVGYRYNGIAAIDITVPAQIDGRPVTGIGQDAFKAFKTIQSVTLPASITYIAPYAFYDCDALTAITIPAKVKNIGEGAFMGCDNLNTVNLVQGLEDIGNFAFKDCAKLTALTLPYGIKTIGDGAFWNCDALDKITIPTTVSKLGTGAFYDCGALAEAKVEGGVNQIGDIVFENAAPNLQVSVKENTPFHEYAEKNGYQVKLIPEPVA